MTELEQKAILSITMMAALADGNRTEQERGEIEKLAASFAGAKLNVDEIYHDVLLRKVSLPDAANQLQSADAKEAAYELAVGACNADGASNDLETKFLTALAQSLNLAPDVLKKYHQDAEAVFNLPVPISGQAAATPKMSEAEMDEMIHKAAIVNAALELMPETLSTLAIIPLQMRMVYRIGQNYGFELDQSYIKDFAGTLGIGMTSQYLEVVARKLLGGMFGGMGRQAASSGMSFAVTYGLGQVAKRYYSSGRKIDTAQLKEIFARMVADAGSMKDRYGQEIQAKITEFKGKRFIDIAKG
ncbi:MAG: DUF533 domain-containing protein [Pseudomonadota bacterium]|nr:DUF533 domain-containing protein [Pseudomonadota bacterium]